MAVASGVAAVEADGAAALDNGLDDAPPAQPARAAATITAPIMGRARREAPALVVILSLSLHTRLIRFAAEGT
jgi:hypothetical protein